MPPKRGVPRRSVLKTIARASGLGDQLSFQERVGKRSLGLDRSVQPPATKENRRKFGLERNGCKSARRVATNYHEETNDGTT
jgi:hypothetical protein